MSENAFMDAKEKTIAQILNDNEKLVIPIFQRDYSWKEDNWKQLWVDIKSGFIDQRYHYMGSIVLVENNSVNEIVDGQQRITTLSMLYLAIIKNFLLLIDKNINKEDNLKRVEDIRNNVVHKRDLYNLNKVENKLVLNETNNPIYENYLVNNKEDEIPEVDSDSNGLMIKCYKYYVDQIRKVCTNEHDDFPDEEKLLNYYTYISQKILFIQITVTDYSNAYTIFETLNDRGLDLTVTDLLKNYIFSLLSKEEHKEAQRLWKQICDNVGEKNLTKYVRHYWNSCHKKVTERDLFRSIKKEVDNEPNKVKELLNTLEKVSYIYSAISEPDNKRWKNDKKIKNYLNDIKIYKVDLCYPVILAIELNITNVELKHKLFKLCSRISFRYIVICEGGANDLEGAYNSLCLKIKEKTNDLDINEEAKTMEKFIVPSETFKLGFKNKVLNTRGNKKLINYILEKIEKAMSGCIRDDYTLEHILPESPDDNWKNVFGEEVKQFIYRLGNYTLLEKKLNNDIGNSEYIEKRPLYEQSQSKMTQSIAANVQIWNREELGKRQKQMAKIADSIWTW